MSDASEKDKGKKKPPPSFDQTIPELAGSEEGGVGERTIPDPDEQRPAPPAKSSPPPQQAMDRLAEEMDLVMARMQAADEKANTYGGCGPRLNEKSDAAMWLDKPGSPKAKLANEKPQGDTVNYDELVKRWMK